VIENEISIIDAFPGFNEIKLAEFRINYLLEVVDKVIIAESKITHSGYGKPLYFSQWISNQSYAIRERVVVVEVPLSHLKTSWEREIFTRESLLAFLTTHYPRARYIISDLDEIPSISQVLNFCRSSGVFHFNTPTSYRRINWLLKDSHASWARGVMGDASLRHHPNVGRFIKFPLIKGHPGAHLSYLGKGHIALQEKIGAFAHTELNASIYNSPSLVSYCDKFRIDHLGRSQELGTGLLEIDECLSNEVLIASKEYFPEYFDQGIGLPSLLSRLYASIRLTSYLSQGIIGKIQRKLFTPEYFFSHKNPLVQVGGLLYIFLISLRKTGYSLLKSKFERRI
jgi:hypothetical protein